MSGLAGYVGLKGAEDAPERLRRAAARFTGPGSEPQVWTEPGFGVVVSGRFQKGSFGEIHEGERHVVACEGYVLNLPELAGGLEGGSRGRLLLELYERYGDGGDGLFPRLNGGFTLAVWDKAEKRLALHVSKFGQRQLYRQESGGDVLFGSEIKVFPELSGRPLAMNPAGLFDNLLAGAQYGTGTCFRGVRRFFQGSVGQVAAGTCTVALPGFLPREAERSTRTPEELADELDALLRRSVARLAGLHDDRVVMLSSGTDSSLVAAYVKEVTGRLSTITQALPGQDESESAERIARHLGSDHRGFFYEVDGENLIAGIERLVEVVEGPNWAQLGHPLSTLSASARDLAHGFFNGAAADAFFGSRGHEAFDDGDQTLFDYVPRPYDPNGVRLIVPLPPGEPRDDFAEIVRPHLPQRPSDRYAFARLHGFMSRLVIQTGSSLAQSLGAEALYPFLDDDVALFSFSVPDALKVNGGETKALLRLVLDRYVPRPLIPAGKIGYWATALEGCYEADRLGPVLDLLAEPRTLERGLYTRANLEKLIQKYRERRAEEGWHRILWQLLSLEIFCRRFLDEV